VQRRCPGRRGRGGRSQADRAGPVRAIVEEVWREWYFEQQVAEAWGAYYRRQQEEAASSADDDATPHRERVRQWLLP